MLKFAKPLLFLIAYLTSAYDANGNMLYAIRSETIPAASGVNQQVSLSLDTGDAADSYTYDALNRLKTAKVSGKNASYTYDGTGLRTSKTVDGVTTAFVNNGGSVAVEIKNGIATDFRRGLGLISYGGGTNNMSPFS